MKLPTGSYLVKPLEMLPGALIKGVVRDKGLAYTEHGEDWKANIDKPNSPEIDDVVLYDMSSSGFGSSRTEVILDGTLYHIIKDYKLVL